ncbi:ABC transporter permease subunit [bacterium]|nr:ABC transporter permease subunit [bacterium]
MTDPYRTIPRSYARGWWRAHALERAAWSLAIWLAFVVVILGPLLAVVAFSFEPSVYGKTGAAPTLLWYRRILTEPELHGPLVRSGEIALVVVAVQLVLGTAIAYSTVRNRVHGARALDALSNITIALPSVVVGLALIAFYGPFGPVVALSKLVFSRSLELTWTFWIVVLAHVLETFPYMVRSVSAVLQKMDPRLESAARSLGARRFHVFRTITLPQLRPALVAGSVLVLSRSVAEFGATIIVVSAVIRTAPIKIYAEAESGSLELASAYSVILMLGSFADYAVMSRWLGKVEARPAD